MMAKHFQSREDSFVLPPLEMVAGSSGNIALMAGDKVISLNFERHLERERKKRLNDMGGADQLDTSELQKEHGPDGA